MSVSASGLFRNAAWTELAVFERSDGVKVTRVEAEFQYEGRLAGASLVTYLMLYRADGTGTYSGWERFEGSWDHRAGTAVFHHQGTFDPQAVRAEVATVPDTGTGSLETLRIHYQVELRGHGPYPFTLEVE